MMQNINYSGNQFIWKYLIILIVTCLAAWLPTITPYHPIAWDKIALKYDTTSFANYLKDFFDKQALCGLLRIYLTAVLIKYVPPIIIPVVAVILQVTLAIILLLVVNRLYGMGCGVVCLTMLFITFPIYYQVILTAYSLPLLLAYILYVICIYISTVEFENKYKYFYALVLTVLSTSALLIREDLAFAFMIMPLLKLQNIHEIKTKKINKILKSLCPTIGCTVGSMLFLALYYLSLKTKLFGEHTNLVLADPQNKPHLNIETIISPTIYLIYSFESLGLFASKQTIRLMFYNCSTFVVCATLTLALTGAILIMKNRCQNIDNYKNSVRYKYLTIWAILNVFAINAVYAFGGGYSLDSRKRLGVSLAFLLFLFSIDRIKGMINTIFKDNRIALVFTLASIITCWMLVGYWQKQKSIIMEIENRIKEERKEEIIVECIDYQKIWTKFSQIDITDGAVQFIGEEHGYNIESKNGKYIARKKK